MKKILLPLVAVALSVVTLFCGCFEGEPGRDGRDGVDGHDVTISEVYEEYVKRYGEISFEDFLYKYLNYTDEDVKNAAGLQATVNKSLMAGVSILTRFTYSSKHQSSIPGITSTRRTYKVYTGSGVILWLDKDAGDAYVATNCHVIYDDSSDEVFAQDVRLYLYGQDERGTNFMVDDTNDIVGDENYRINAQVIGASVTYDIALLKVTASEVLKRSDACSASFSTAADVYSGEFVYAVGNASGEGMSISDGMISKDSEYIEVGLSDLNESKSNEYRVLRTTAPINHGNSGGALFNSRGEIVAIVNAKDEGEDIDNMGYALPANNVRRLLKLMYEEYVAAGNSLPRGGGINKAYLNIQTVVTDSYSVYNEDAGRAEITETVRIADIDGMPAKGRLQTGDIIRTVKIMSADGTLKEDIAVSRRYHVPEVMISVRAGDKVTLTVEREGQNVDITLDFTSDCFKKLK